MFISFNSHLPVPYTLRPQNVFESVENVYEKGSGVSSVNVSGDAALGNTLLGSPEPEVVDLFFRVRNEEQAINSIRSAEFSLVEIRSILMRLREAVCGFSSDAWSEKQRELISDKFSELNSTTYQVLKVFESKIGDARASDNKNFQSIGLLPTDEGFQSNNIVVTDASPGVYRFGYSSEKTEIELSNGLNSQVIKLSGSKDITDNANSLILNFDKLGITVNLSVESLSDEVGMLDDKIIDQEFVVIDVFERFRSKSLVSKQTLEQFIAKIKFLSDFFKGEGKSSAGHSIIAHLEQALEQESRMRSNLGHALNSVASNIKTLEQQLEKAEIAVDEIKDSTTAQTVLQRSRSRIVGQRADRLLTHAQSVDPVRVLRLLDI